MLKLQLKQIISVVLFVVAQATADGGLSNFTYVHATGACVSPFETNSRSSNSTECTQIIQTAVESCRADSQCDGIRLDSGATYPIDCSHQNQAAIELNSTVSIRFGAEYAYAPATLILDQRNWLCRGIVAANASNISIENVIIDSYRPPFTLFEAVDVQKSQGEQQNVTLKYARGCDNSFEGLLDGNWPWLATVDTLFPFSKLQDRIVLPQEHGSPGRGCKFSAPSPESDKPGMAYQPLTVLNHTTRMAQMPCNGTNPPKPGDLLLARHYSNHGALVWCIGCSNFTVSATVVVAGPGMGIRCDMCDGVTRVVSGSGTKRRIQRNCTTHTAAGSSQHDEDSGPSLTGGRLAMSATADALHFMSTRGKIDIHAAHCEGQGDDNMNVHGNYITVLDAVLGTNSTWVAYRRDHGAGWVTSLPVFLVGDSVQLVRGDTMMPFRDPRSIGDPSTFRSPAQRHLLAANSTHALLDGQLPSGFLPGRDVFISLDAQPTSVGVRDSLFNRTRSKGLMLSGGVITVGNCLFDTVPHAHILLGSGSSIDSSYTEGPAATRATIVNNVFVGGAQGSGGQDALGVVQLSACGQSLGQPACHPLLNTTSGEGFYAQVTVSNNTFHRLSFVTPFVHAGLVDGLTIRENLVLYSGGVQPAPGTGDGCLYGNVPGTVTADGNICEFFGSRINSGRMCRFSSTCANAPDGRPAAP